MWVEYYRVLNLLNCNFDIPHVRRTYCLSFLTKHFLVAHHRQKNGREPGLSGFDKESTYCWRDTPHRFNKNQPGLDVLRGSTPRPKASGRQSRNC